MAMRNAQRQLQRRTSVRGASDRQLRGLAHSAATRKGRSKPQTHRASSHRGKGQLRPRIRESVVFGSTAAAATAVGDADGEAPASQARLGRVVECYAPTDATQQRMEHMQRRGRHRKPLDVAETGAHGTGSTVKVFSKYACERALCRDLGRGHWCKRPHLTHPEACVCL